MSDETERNDEHEKVSEQLTQELHEVHKRIGGSLCIIRIDEAKQLVTQCYGGDQPSDILVFCEILRGLAQCLEEATALNRAETQSPRPN